jgi:hypothetical protein
MRFLPKFFLPCTRFYWCVPEYTRLIKMRNPLYVLSQIVPFTLFNVLSPSVSVADQLCFQTRPNLTLKNNIVYSHRNEEEQETQCTYNATFRRVSVTIVAVKKQYVLHILSVYCVALAIQHAILTRHKAIRGLFGCTRFFHIIP